MSEKVKQPNEKPAFGGTGDGSGLTPLTETPLATVCHGPYAESLPVVGMSIEKVRRKFADRFNIAKDAQAVLDGIEVPPDTIIQTGQMLTFVRRAGEKGAGDTLIIEGNKVTAVSPEGQRASIDIASFMSHLTIPKMDTAGCILPDGVRSVMSRGKHTIWIHETPPVMLPVKVSRGNKSETTNISLPYIITLVSLIPNSIIGKSECYFRNSPLENLNDKLFFPALPNCVQIANVEDKDDRRPLSALVVDNIDLREAGKAKNVHEQMYAALRATLKCLFEVDFDRKLKNGEQDNWFELTTKKVKEVSTIAKWAAASKEDNLFGIEVEWVPTNLSVRQIAERMFFHSGVGLTKIETAEDVAREVFKYKGNGKFEKA